MLNGLAYIPSFINEEQHDRILSILDEQPWSNELKRRVQHYGYKYDYRQRAINSSMKVDGLLPWMVACGKYMVEKKLFPKQPDQAIVNEYQPGQGISKHIDCEPCFHDTIASLSLGSACIMEFHCQHRIAKTQEIYLEPRSLVVIYGVSSFN
jgi:alkylated DNA repair dioxygenase AlkB